MHLLWGENDKIFNMETARNLRMYVILPCGMDSNTFVDLDFDTKQQLAEIIEFVIVHRNLLDLTYN